MTINQKERLLIYAPTSPSQGITPKEALSRLLTIKKQNKRRNLLKAMLESRAWFLQLQRV